MADALIRAMTAADVEPAELLVGEAETGKVGDMGDVVAGEAGHGSDDSRNDGEPGCRAIVAAVSGERCQR